MNIGLANQIKMITDKMSINIHDVINASSTKQFGLQNSFQVQVWGVIVYQLIHYF